MNGRLFTLSEVRDDHPRQLTVHLEGDELARFAQPVHTPDGWHIAVPDGRMWMVVPVGGFPDVDGAL